jgi:hypothetical protein
LITKQAGKPTAGNPHGGFDAAGIGNGLTVWLVRHSQRKRGATDRPVRRQLFLRIDDNYFSLSTTITF